MCNILVFNLKCHVCNSRDHLSCDDILYAGDERYLTECVHNLSTCAVLKGQWGGMRHIIVRRGCGPLHSCHQGHAICCQCDTEGCNYSNDCMVEFPFPKREKILKNHIDNNRGRQRFQITFSEPDCVDSGVTHRKYLHACFGNACSLVEMENPFIVGDFIRVRRCGVHLSCDHIDFPICCECNTDGCNGDLSGFKCYNCNAEFQPDCNDVRRGQTKYLHACYSSICSMLEMEHPHIVGAYVKVRSCGEQMDCYHIDYPVCCQCDTDGCNAGGDCSCAYHPF
uniref:Uncharacterized protein n=1 Tax=Glossina brevipalpis TaxID=37001 RepID=A0A1A9WK68_9MUSC